MSISSFPLHVLSQEYMSLLTAGARALAGRPRGIGALGCVCVVCGLCVQGLRGLRISMVLVLSECFHPSGNSSCSSSLPTGLRMQACEGVCVVGALDGSDGGAW